MPNYCSYDMKIRGIKKDVAKLCEWMTATYDYSENNTGLKVYIDRNGKQIPTEHHVGYRVFDFYYNEEFLDSIDDESEIVLYGNGECAWSVCTCMINDKTSGKGYLNEYSHGINEKAIAIEDACRELNLEVEIYSSEVGLMFSEHYLINNKGNFLIFSETEYTEIWLGENYQIDNYETFKTKFEEHTDICPITKEQYEKAVEEDYPYITLCEWLDDTGEWWPWVIE